MIRKLYICCIQNELCLQPKLYLMIKFFFSEAMCNLFTYGGYLSSIAIERYHAFPVVILWYSVACHSTPKVEQSCFVQKSLKNILGQVYCCHRWWTHRRTKHLNLGFEIKECSYITLLGKFFYCLASVIKICKKK